MFSKDVQLMSSPSAAGGGASTTNTTPAAVPTSAHQKNKQRKQAARKKKKAAAAAASSATPAAATSTVNDSKSAGSPAAATSTNTATIPTNAVAIVFPTPYSSALDTFQNAGPFDSVIDVKRTANRGNSCFAKTAYKAGTILYREIAPCSAPYGDKDKDETMLALAELVVFESSCAGMYYHVQDTDRKTFVTAGGPPPLPSQLVKANISDKAWYDKGVYLPFTFLY
jgi:hypothetical protein